ncbi:hypothetical protein BGZ94_008874 [Podila epigama]|nr:hypothetical protein BGZ94_008874 [Podila epigama]
MRTTELINLLRDPKQNATVRPYLATLHLSVRVHLLGELSKWLTVELLKYQTRRQVAIEATSAAPSTAPLQEEDLEGDSTPQSTELVNGQEVNIPQETRQQRELRHQIRRTLLAIQTVLGSPPLPSSSSSSSSSSTANNAQLKDQVKALGGKDDTRQRPKSVSLNSKQEQEILESLLRSILVGCVPLGPAVDSSEVQLMCAKILLFLTNRRNENGFFPTQDVIQTIISLSEPSSTDGGDLDTSQKREKEQQQQQQQYQQNKESGKGGTLRVDLLATLRSLLSSPLTKLQDSGMFLLADHSRLRQLDAAWSAIRHLRGILESLCLNLDNLSQGRLGTRDDVNGNQTVSEELDATLTHQHRALVVLHLFLHEFGQRHTKNNESLADTNAQGRTKNLHMNALRDVIDVRLCADLWKATLGIVVPDLVKFAVRDVVMSMTTNIVSGVCYVFKDEAVFYFMEEGSETLMAWFAYFIVSQDQQTLLPQEVYKDSMDESQAGVEQQQQQLQQHKRQEKMDNEYKSRAQSLHCCARLGETMVTMKKYQVVSMSESSLVGKVLMRRSLEFLESILEARPLPIVVSSEGGLQQNKDDMTTLPYAIRIIQHKPEVLEAMLGILDGYLGFTNDFSIVTKGNVVFVLVALLADAQSLFLGQATVSKAVQQRIHGHVLSLLMRILPTGLGTSLWETPQDIWEIGCPALVEMILLPLEQRGEPSHGADRSMPKSSHSAMAIQVFELFWIQNVKGRGLLAKLFGPRFYKPHMVKVLLDISKSHVIPSLTRTASTTTSTSSTVASTIRPGVKVVTSWGVDRISNLLEMMIYFGRESSVRIHMRESWSALAFMVTLLGACLKRLQDLKFRRWDRLTRMVVWKCFDALACFWYDQSALVTLIQMQVNPESFDVLGVLDGVVAPECFLRKDPGGDSTTTGSSAGVTLSIVPILLGILAPGIERWTMDTMLETESIKDSKPRTVRRKMRNPLLERTDEVVLEAARMLGRLSKFKECQDLLISKPGAVWTLSRIMVERAIVLELEKTQKRQKEHEMREEDEVTSTLPDNEVDCEMEQDGKESAGIGSGVGTTEQGGDMGAHGDLMGNSLRATLTRVISSADLVRPLVVNNIMTELFAPIMTFERSSFFYGHVVKGESDEVASTSEVQGSIIRPPEHRMLPLSCQQHYFWKHFLHFGQAVERVLPQLERLYQFAVREGGAAAADDRESEAISDMLYGLREQCAIMFLYVSRPESFSGLDPDKLLEMDSHLGNVFRMLTLEMDFVVEEEGDPGENRDEKENAVMAEEAGLQKEVAAMRKFMAGVAIEPWIWRHLDVWRERHARLVASLDMVLTTEHEDHIQRLNGQAKKDKDINTFMDTTGAGAGSDTGSSVVEADVVPVKFLVQGQEILFSDRGLLARASPYFETLLTGAFLETHQERVTLHDVDPMDLQVLLECVRESATAMPAQYLLPEDLPFEMVVRLMISAERYSIEFIKRLAQHWILTTLHRRESPDLSSAPTSPPPPPPEQHHKQQSPSTMSTEQEIITDKGVKRGPGSPVSGHEDKRIRVQSSQGDLGPEKVKDDEEEGDVFVDADTEETVVTIQEEPIHECLLMLYEHCSDLRHGDIFTVQHPFHDLVWDALARLCLCLGPTTTLPRFKHIFENGGEEKIQEFLKVIYLLMMNRVQ